MIFSSSQGFAVEKLNLFTASIAKKTSFSNWAKIGIFKNTAITPVEINFEDTKVVVPAGWYAWAEEFPQSVDIKVIKVSQFPESKLKVGALVFLNERPKDFDSIEDAAKTHLESKQFREVSIQNWQNRKWLVTKLDKVGQIQWLAKTVVGSEQVRMSFAQGPPSEQSNLRLILKSVEY